MSSTINQKQTCQPQTQEPSPRQNRRDFLKLGAAIMGSSLLPTTAIASDLLGAATTATAGALPIIGANPNGWPSFEKYAGTKLMPGMCQLCSTICGIVGHVKDGRIIKIEGNPNDPNSRGRICARGQAGLNHQYHPERLLYPLKRVGARGEGKWKRISWDEALDEISTKLKAIRDSGKPEDFAFHQGRQRSKDALKRLSLIHI